MGHALEFVQSDCIARYHRELLGEDTVLLSGADENALKNVQAAEKAGLPVREFIDANAKLFQNLAEQLSVQIDVFQRGSDQKTHFPSSQQLWKLCEQKGDIYQKKYKGLYCVGCETFYTPDELNAQGECFEHPGRKLEEVEEENYFFKLSAYQDKLIPLIESDVLNIMPVKHKNEILGFLRQPLQDISISRSNARAKNWGVPVPSDDSQRMYVWFDALNIYQSGIGFGWDEKKYQETWPADVHVIGKGIIRFHAVYWPAFLLSAGLPLPKSLHVHGYIVVNGQKMSKTLGNVIDPFEIVQKYGCDPVRYYFLKEIPAFGDGDFSEERFKNVYNADLANGLGNLISRVTKLAQTNEVILEAPSQDGGNRAVDLIKPHMEDHRFNIALETLWECVTKLNHYIDSQEPWKQDKDAASQTIKAVVEGTVELVGLRELAHALKPFLPQTAEDMVKQFGGDRVLKHNIYFKRT
ncbi:MAG: Methionine--tRNA ligase [Microgenomates bacterium OLB22]|nr:MAG: Methionine--tRNA ligase [Microgenomates bacterium OLB22]